MSLPIYPKGDLDKSQSLMGLLGSYWQNDFPDKDTLAGIMRAREVLFSQALIDQDENKSMVSRHNVPVYHTEMWRPIVLRQSMLSDKSLAPVTYGPDKALYGIPGVPPFDRIFTYGASLVAGTTNVFPLDTSFKHVRMICNRITDPTLVLVEGVDFKLDDADHVITLPVDVFNDPRIPTKGVYDANGMMDTEVTLWAFSCEMDLDFIWDHYGYVINARSQSSVRYRDFVNAVWDAHMGGSSVDSLKNIMAAAFDVPIAQDDETVELILDGSKRQIITDKQVYTVSADATLIVGVGDKLKRGDFMVDTVEFIDISRSDDRLALYSAQATSIPLVVPLAGLKNIPIYPVASGQAVPPVYAGPPIAPSARRPPSLIDPNRLFFETGNPSFSFSSSPVPISDFVTGMPTCLGFDRTSTPDLPEHFRNDAVPMTLSDLPVHTHLELAFDLMLFGEWQGNDGSAAWSLTVDGTTLLNTNFSNTETSAQAYPANIGSGSYPRYTEAVEPTPEHPVWSCIVSLVPPKAEATYPGDYTVGGALATQQPSKYRLTFTIAHTRSTANIVFSASGLGSGRYMINPSSTSLSCGPIFKKYVESSTDNPITNFSGGIDRFAPDGAINPIDITYTNNRELQTLIQWPSFKSVGSDELVDYPGPCRMPSMYYPAMWWGLNDIQINALTSVRTQLPNLPTDQIVNPDLPGLSLDRKYITGAYFGALFFANKAVPVEYIGVDSKGFVEVRFEVTGFPGDVEQFWTDVHARGVAQGLTLANYLDKRAQFTGQPKASDLPATLNPLLFMLRHIMKNNLLVMKVKRGVEGPDALSPDLLSVLRFTLPPQMSYIIFTEIVAPAEEFDGPVASSVITGSGPIVSETVAVSITERPPVCLSVDGVLI